MQSHDVFRKDCLCQLRGERSSLRSREVGGVCLLEMKLSSVSPDWWNLSLFGSSALLLQRLLLLEARSLPSSKGRRLYQEVRELLGRNSPLPRTTWNELFVEKMGELPLEDLQSFWFQAKNSTKHSCKQSKLTKHSDSFFSLLSTHSSLVQRVLSQTTAVVAKTA